MSNDNELTRRGLMTRLLAGASIVVLGGCERLSQSTWFPKVLGLGEKATYKNAKTRPPAKSDGAGIPGNRPVAAIPQQRDVNA